MAKSPNAAAIAQLDANYCTGPFIVVDIFWGDDSPVGVYADRDYEYAEGKIKALGGLDTLVKIAKAGSAGSLSITLDDTDGSIKAIMDTTDIHMRKVKVYQAFGELPLSDRFLLLTGEIETPVKYDHTTREIRFEIVSTVEGEEIGFSPEQGDLDELGNVSESAIGKAWPLCFGSPVRVPAVKLTERIRGSSLTSYGLLTIQELEDLCSRAQTYTEVTILKEAADTNPGFSDENYGIRINNVSSAAESLYTLLESLINDSPTLEGGLRTYVRNCSDLYRKLQEFTATASQLETTQGQVDTLSAAVITIGQSIVVAEQNIANGVDVVANQMLLNGTPAVFGWVDGDWVEITPATDGLYIQLANTQALLLAAGILTASLTATLLALEIEIDALEEAIALAKVALSRFVITEIIVEGGEDFPQGVDVVIVINGLHFKGKFASRTFTVEDANLAADVGVEITGIPTIPNQFKVNNPELFNLKGKFCFFPSKGVILAGEQIDDAILFQPLLWEQTGALPALEGVLLNGQPIIREIYDIRNLGGVIQETSVVIRRAWINSLATIPDWANGLARIQNKDYSISVGDEVYLAENYSDVYVANLIESTEILEVFAYRVDEKGVRRLRPVPSRYYTVNLSDSIAGQTPTTISFNRPLTEYVDENWEEDIYVTLTSSVGDSTSDQIKYLIENYTLNLTADTATFASVKAAIAAYPSNFALLEKVPALPTIEDIAFQARCAVLVRNEIAYLKYIAAEDAAIKSIIEGVVETKTLELEFTITENLVTKLTGEWRADLSKEEPNKVIVRNNIPKYGLLEEDLDIYIYNSESLVVKTITYWAIQWSNTWKYIRFQAFLNMLALDIEDTVDIAFADDFLATGTVKGRVRESNYNSKDHSMTFLIWTAVRSGEMTAYPFAFPATASLVLEYPTDDDPFAGS